MEGISRDFDGACDVVVVRVGLVDVGAVVEQDGGVAALAIFGGLADRLGSFEFGAVVEEELEHFGGWAARGGAEVGVFGLDVAAGGIGAAGEEEFGEVEFVCCDGAGEGVDGPLEVVVGLHAVFKEEFEDAEGVAAFQGFVDDAVFVDSPLR